MKSFLSLLVAVLVPVSVSAADIAVQENPAESSAVQETVQAPAPESSSAISQAPAEASAKDAVVENAPTETLPAENAPAPSPAQDQSVVVAPPLVAPAANPTVEAHVPTDVERAQALTQLPAGIRREDAVIIARIQNKNTENCYESIDKGFECVLLFSQALAAHNFDLSRIYIPQNPQFPGEVWVMPVKAYDQEDQWSRVKFRDFCDGIGWHATLVQYD